MKRFYETVTLEQTGQGTAVRLDGRSVRTIGKRELTVPSQALARAIADEWCAQVGEIVPSTMPMTQIANTALDHVGPNRSDVAEVTAAYGRSDLLCYRAESPEELVARQVNAWDPVLAWFAQSHGADLAATSGIIHLAQSDHSIATMNRMVAERDDWHLAALSLTTARLGSLVLALGLVSGKFDAAEAMALGHIDEDFQIERWGQDDGALARRASIAEDVAAARRLVDLLAERDQEP